MARGASLPRHGPSTPPGHELYLRLARACVELFGHARRRVLRTPTRLMRDAASVSLRNPTERRAASFWRALPRKSHRNVRGRPGLRRSPVARPTRLLPLPRHWRAQRGEARKPRPALPCSRRNSLVPVRRCRASTRSAMRWVHSGRDSRLPGSRCMPLARSDQHRRRWTRHGHNCLRRLLHNFHRRTSTCRCLLVWDRQTPSRAPLRRVHSCSV
jgi:hypothetical protein